MKDQEAIDRGIRIRVGAESPEGNRGKPNNDRTKSTCEQNRSQLSGNKNRL
jgi:hypothetical protein